MEISSAARRDLHRLPEKVAAAVAEFITGPLAEAPARVSKPLRNELSPYRSARRGDYRVLIRIDDAADTVLVVRIDHRSHVYRSP
ncbi:MAG: type II toxin-antitoxin system RelE/ParE family toxin [Actinophytocola sp.]|nr:type II toxin-antitoxin system RelE/ParE family toxin [Actinophytocola sp.]